MFSARIVFPSIVCEMAATANDTTVHSYEGDATMVVRAAGMMVFGRSGPSKQTQYLMMRASYGAKHWTPPKGTAIYFLTRPKKIIERV